jgi:hypothetical protein
MLKCSLLALFHIALNRIIAINAARIPSNLSNPEKQGLFAFASMSKLLADDHYHTAAFFIVWAIL